VAFKNLPRFQRELKKAMKKVPEELLVVAHTKVHLDLLADIIENNDVDTGRSQNGWQSSIGAPTETDPPGGAPIKDTEIVKSQALERAAAVLSGLGPFDSSHIFNNVNYVKYIEERTSFIDLALQRAVARINSPV